MGLQKSPKSPKPRGTQCCVVRPAHLFLSLCNAAFGCALYGVRSPDPTHRQDGDRPPEKDRSCYHWSIDALDKRHLTLPKRTLWLRARQAEIIFFREKFASCAILSTIGDEVNPFLIRSFVRLRGLPRWPRHPQSFQAPNNPSNIRMFFTL